jgi:hypothetical protein
MTERKLEHIVSTYPSKHIGYQNKRNKGLEATIIFYVSTMYQKSLEYANNNCNLLIIKNTNDFLDYVFDIFVDNMIYVNICERYCLELCFNKIRIKNGKCNPCVVYKATIETMRFLFD